MWIISNMDNIYYYFPSYSFLRLRGLGNIKQELTKQGNGALIQIWPTSQISLKGALCAVKTTDIQDENLKLKSLCVWYLVVLKKLFSGPMKLKKNYSVKTDGCRMKYIDVLLSHFQTKFRT